MIKSWPNYIKALWSSLFNVFRSSRNFLDSQIGDAYEIVATFPILDIAKFGYRSKYEIKNLNHSFIFLAID
jgi:hypothetical protein